MAEQIAVRPESGYLAPRQVVAGPGTSAQTAKELRTWGIDVARVMVVADRVVADAGLLDGVVVGLKELGVRYEVFDQIAGEPTDEIVDRAVGLARGLDATCVIGVGGGSALDAAKIVALLVTNSGTVADWLGPIEPPVPVAPLALVPTTTGTGSEATRIAMVTVAGVKKVVSCAQFVPLVAVLDQQLVSNLPPAVVASTGMDAVAHAVESMLSTNRSAFSLGAASHAVEILMSALGPAVLEDDIEARGRLLYAAHLSGLALNAGVVLGHSLAYVIARHAPMPHGVSCSLALPYCLAYNRSVDESLAAHISLLVTDGASRELSAAAEAVDTLAGRLGLPQSLSAVGIATDELSAMAAETVQDYPRPNNPVPMTESGLAGLFAHMHAGDLRSAWPAGAAN